MSAKDLPSSSFADDSSYSADSPTPPFSSYSPPDHATDTPSGSASPRSDLAQQSSSTPPPRTMQKKRHVCPTCQKAFTTSGHLSRHARVHTGERNHKCPFPGCETRCSRQDNLQQHYRIHLSPGSRRSSGSAPRAALARALGTEGQPAASTKRRSKYHLTVAQTPVLPASPPSPPSTPPALELAYRPTQPALPAPDSPPALTPAYRVIPLPSANDYPPERSSSSPDAHARPFASGSAAAPLRPASGHHQSSQHPASYSRPLPGSMLQSHDARFYQSNAQPGPSGMESSGGLDHGEPLSTFGDYDFGASSAGGSALSMPQHSSSSSKMSRESMLIQFEPHVTYLPTKQRPQDVVDPTARARHSHSNSPSPVSSVSRSSHSSGYSTPPVWSVGGSPGASPLVQSSGLVYASSPELNEAYSSAAHFPAASSIHTPLPASLHDQYGQNSLYQPGLPFVEDTALPNSIYSMPGWEAAVADANAMRKMSYEARGRGASYV